MVSLSWKFNRELILLFILIAFPYEHSAAGQLPGDDSSLTIQKIKAVASMVIKSSTFKFVDDSTGKKYGSTSDAPDIARIRPESPYNDWRYWNGVLNIAMINLGKVMNDPSCVTFSEKSISFDFDNYGYFRDRYVNQDKWSYPFGQKIVIEVLDDYGAMGASLIEVYEQDRQKRYREYIDQAIDFLETKQDRLADGTLVRPVPRKWTLWADDLYMSVSFLSRMGELTHDDRYLDDAANQVINFHKYLFDSLTGLNYHCWFSDSMKNGVACWGRANGWIMLAQIDLLDRLPANYSKRDTLLSIFREEIAGIARYQSDNGLWHQLLDKPDSYLETSCSAMFTYVIARGVRKGYLERQYESVARRGWNGVMSRIRPDGEIEGVCEGTGVGDDLAFYYARPTPLNDPHGIGPVLLAGAEILRLAK